MLLCNNCHYTLKLTMKKLKAAATSVATLLLTTMSQAQTNNVNFSNDPASRELTTEWSFKEAETTLWAEAQVPGTVHMDLFRAGRVPEPYYRLNEHYMQWIDKRDWEYKTTFEVSPEEFNAEKLTMIFEGLDTFCDVYINDKKVLEADNMFREWSIDLKECVKEGSNEMRLYFYSAVNKGLELYNAYGYDLPAANDQSENGELNENERVSIHVRKAPYHFGWDWGPRFVTCGVWKPIYIVAQSDTKVTEVFYNQKKVTAKKAEITVEAVVNSFAENGEEVTLEVYDKDSKTVLASDVVKLQKGDNALEIPMTIKNPELWWCNGLGEAHLYDLAFNVVKNGETVSSLNSKIGVRSIKLINKKDKAGYSFYFELNGVPVFMKGANHIPNDLFVDRMTREVYESEIEGAVLANMNMLRVWGGGIYENDYFYDLCDERGILVWQDFMFACSMYPDNEEFYASVAEEVEDNVKRLRNHASIALWCGNNEIDTAWAEHTEFGGWGWRKRAPKDEAVKMWKAYTTIFREIMPEAVARYGGGVDYRHSSPCTSEEGVNSSDKVLGDGDVHYWGVWHGKKPFEEYHSVVGRFMSEYGFQSFPEMRTIEEYAVEADYDIESEVMRSHQRSPIGNATISEYMAMYYNVPEGFEDYIYLQQVLQGVGIQTAIEAHRHNMPYTMGSLYWQINDCWPVASWSSMDYYRRWKALHYYVKKSFESVLLTSKYEDGCFGVYMVNDGLESIRGVDFSVVVMDVCGEELSRHSVRRNVGGNSVTEVCEFEGDDIFEGDNIFAVLTAEKDGVEIARNVFYPAKVRDMVLGDCEPEIEVSQLSENSVELRISCDKLIKNLWVDFGDTEGFFSDNYMDVLPNDVVTVTFTSKERIDAEQLKTNLKYKHIGSLKY